MNKTTKKDFEYFKDRCEKYLELLGLKSWTVYYRHEELNKDLADCTTTYTGRAATLRLGTIWNIPVTKQEINISALHECLEILLSPLWSQALERQWSEDDYVQEHHAIIRVLEKLLIK